VTDHLAYAHHAAVVAVLRGMNIRARTVSGAGWVGVEVVNGSVRILWSNMIGRRGDQAPYPVPWGWTEVQESGRLRVGRSQIATDASPEDVAMMIALAYAEPDDAPSL